MKRSMGARLGIGLLAVLAIAVFLQAQQIRRPLLRGPFGLVLNDPDSYLRWHLVQRALDGEGVRIRWIDADNAPWGRLNEWTAPTTMIGCSLVRLVEATGQWDRAAAETLAGHWMGPWLGCLTILLIAWLGWRTGGWVVAACWLVVWPTLRPVLYATAYGNTDHHALHQLLMVAMVGGCLAWARSPSIPGGIFVGLASGLGLWSAGSELLPAWLCVAVLAFLECRTRAEAGDDAKRGFWRAWWVTGLVLTGAAWLFEFWPDPFHDRLELLSIWHVGLWCVAGGLLEAGRLRPWTPRQQGLLALAALLVVLLLAGAVRGFDWGHLHVYQDPRFQWQVTVTREFQGWFVDGWLAGLRHLWRGYGLLPIAGLVLLFNSKNLGPRTRWVLVTAFGWLVLSAYQLRWESLMVVPLVLGVGLALVEWPGLHRRWLAPLICLVATLPSWLLLYHVRAQTRPLLGRPELGPHAQTFALQAAQHCLARGEQGQPPVVLASWDQGGILVGLGDLRVVGTGYWSNLDGLFDGHQLLTTASAEEFKSLAQRRQVGCLVVRDPDGLRADIAMAFIVLHGRIPSRDEIENTVAWRLASSAEVPGLDCPELKKLAPAWRIIRCP